jgi:hypothetical protein
MRRAALDAYGRVCVCCGEAEEVFLVIDHINGGGRKHLSTLTRSFYEWLRVEGYPPGFQTLCHNCNWAKHVRGVCPHQLVLDGDPGGKVEEAPDALDVGEPGRPQ